MAVSFIEHDKRTSTHKEMNKMVDNLYKLYTKGFVANVSKGEAPEKAKGLAKYLAKYMASPQSV